MMLMGLDAVREKLLWRKAGFTFTLFFLRKPLFCIDFDATGGKRTTMFC